MPPGSREGLESASRIIHGLQPSSSFDEPERGPGLRGDIMPDLPERADIDQLRRKARELLRAAAAGEPEALARFRAVSERPTLAAAQLAIAREHGFRSWPALRSEVESRRPSTDWQLRGGTAGRRHRHRPGPMVVRGSRDHRGRGRRADHRHPDRRPGKTRLWRPRWQCARGSSRARVQSQALGFPSCATSPSPMIRARRPPWALGRGHARPQPGPGQRLCFEVTCALDPIPEGGQPLAGRAGTGCFRDTPRAIRAWRPSG